MLKLPTHNRYDYSVIEKRPDFSWPDGKRLAFYVALNVEHFAFLTGRGADPTQRGGPQTQRNYAWRDYGLRVGIWRIFRLLDQLRLPMTILLNSLVCEHYPEIVERIRRRGDDVCAHGRTNAESRNQFSYGVYAGGGRRLRRHAGLRVRTDSTGLHRQSLAGGVRRRQRRVPHDRDRYSARGSTNAGGSQPGRS